MVLPCALSKMYQIWLKQLYGLHLCPLHRNMQGENMVFNTPQSTYYVTTITDSAFHPNNKEIIQFSFWELLHIVIKIQMQM